MKTLLLVLPVLLLAGCFQSNASLYGDSKSLQPFRVGQLESRSSGNPPEIGHTMLTLEPGGVYRLTNNDKNDFDFGQYYRLRFFALTGAPAGTFVYEAIYSCKPGDKNCDSASEPPVYGLVRVTGQGAEMINPDCPQGGPVDSLPGVTADGYGTCTFSDRATLEKALLPLAGTDWKANTSYRFTDASR